MGLALFCSATGINAAMAQDRSDGPGPFVLPGGALDVTVSGYVEMRMHFADRKISEFGTRDATNGQTVNFRTDQELQITARGLHDPTGIEYGARMEIELGGAGATNARFDEAWLFFRGRVGEMRLGNEDDVMDDLKLGAPAISAGTGGIDGDQLTSGIGVRIFDSNDATKIRFISSRIAGFQIGANYVPQTEAEGQDFGSSNDDGFRNYGAVAANYLNTFAGIDVGAFAGANTGNSNAANDFGNLTGYAFAGLLGYGGVVASGYWGTNGEDNDELWNVGVYRDFGLVAMSFAYGRINAVGVEDPYTFVWSTDTPLLRGVALQSELAYTDGGTVVQVGAERNNPVIGFEGLLEITVGF